MGVRLVGSDVRGDIGVVKEVKEGLLVGELLLECLDVQEWIRLELDKGL